MLKKRHRSKIAEMPVLPLRGLMLLPYMVLHFDVGRVKSIAALEAALQADRRILIVTQFDAEVENPTTDQLPAIGTVAEIKQVLNLAGNEIRVSVEGLERGEVTEVLQETPFISAKVKTIQDMAVVREAADRRFKLESTVKALYEEYFEAGGRISEDSIASVKDITDPSQLADVVAANVLRNPEDRLDILNRFDVDDRLERLCAYLMQETDIAKAEKSIQDRVRVQVDKNQKEYYLREQIRAIQTELGDTEDSETDAIRKRLEETPLNEEARQKVQKELDRLGRMAPGTPEISLSMNYIEWILDLPWGKITQDNLDLKSAREVLNQGHYGLDKVKERIIEYLAVLSVKKDLKGPILCFVGPPGVGKTSIARSIAEAIGRKFVQMSLGGVRDEAEIRGHRRTYIGAIPGRIISGIKQAGVMNPVFLFDEIDKMSSDFKGDPASAMLEVLDAEQNHAFRDHYLELPFDLSQVLFITTANSEENIPPALLDRMELIEVPSYTEQEKLQIARNHLLPKQISEHGLAKSSVKINDDILRTVIEDYTREAGVRTLERTIGSIVRKATVEMLEEQKKSITVNLPRLRKYLGGAQYLRDGAEQENAIGVVNGLAFTTVGGELLKVECTTMKGSGVLQLTGKLGDVMQESAKAALSWVRSNAARWNIPPEFFKENDIHIHVPEGAVPKDGPSAGAALATVLVSTLTGSPVRADLAMTGEITLRGRVLPIGGLKEKLMAAYREKLNTVLIPAENQKDLEDVAPEVLQRLKMIPVTKLDEVLKEALLPKSIVQEYQSKAETSEASAVHAVKSRPAGYVGG